VWIENLQNHDNLDERNLQEAHESRVSLARRRETAGNIGEKELRAGPSSVAGSVGITLISDRVGKTMRREAACSISEEELRTEPSSVAGSVSTTLISDRVGKTMGLENDEEETLRTRCEYDDVQTKPK